MYNCGEKPNWSLHLTLGAQDSHLGSLGKPILMVPEQAHLDWRAWTNTDKDQVKGFKGLEPEGESSGCVQKLKVTVLREKKQEWNSFPGAKHWVC